jgi:polysaccharide deacetylase family protein (PEP-CTERM system associated)
MGVFKDRRRAATRRQGSPVKNAISVDVEDYFQTEAMGKTISRSMWNEMPTRVEANTRRLFELFAKHQVRGTFFFLGWVAERFPKLVQDAVSLGHEIGCHSYWHRMVSRLSAEEFRKDTRRAKEIIENAGGMRTIGYRAPSFSLLPGTEWAHDILADCGFLYDSSVYPVKHDLYGNAGLPRGPYKTASGRILELPMPTLAIAGRNFPIGGGGYLRILPGSFTRWALARVNRKDAMRTIVYTHPWEIDSDQPRLPASFRSRFRQYTNLSSTSEKLGRLLTKFDFGPIAEVFAAEMPGSGARNVNVPLVVAGRSDRERLQRVCENGA